MKIWVDDTHPAPKGYFRCKNVEQVIDIIKVYDRHSQECIHNAYLATIRDDDKARERYCEDAKSWNVELINMKKMSRRKITKLLNWLNMTNHNCHVIFH